MENQQAEKEIYNTIQPHKQNINELDIDELAENWQNTQQLLDTIKLHNNMVESALIQKLYDQPDLQYDTPYGLMKIKQAKTYKKPDRPRIQSALLSKTKLITDDGEVLEGAEAQLKTVLDCCRLEPRKTDMRKYGFNIDLYYEEVSVSIFNYYNYVFL